MWAYLIIIGVIGILVAVFLSNSSSDGIKAPPASPFKWIFGVAGLLCWAIAGWLILSVSNGTVWNGFVFFVFALVFFGSGIALFGAASRADQKHADNMRSRAERKEQHARHEIAQINLESARDTAEKELMLADERRKAEAARLERQRKEDQLKTKFINQAEALGLDIERFIGLNYEQLQRDANFQDFIKRETVRLQGIKIEADIQLDAADRIQLRQTIKELENDLTDLRITRRDIELNQKDKKLRKQLLGDKDRQITQVEDDIREKNRLLQIANRQEPKRISQT